MALAGFLIRCGWTDDEAKRSIEAIAKIAGNDAEIKTNVVEPTRAKLEAGQKVTGWKRLYELLGAGKPIEKIPDWLGYDSRADYRTESGNARTNDPGKGNSEDENV